MIEFTVPLPKDGVQYLDHRKAEEDSKQAQWAFRESVLEAARERHAGREPYGRVVLSIASLSRGYGATDGRWRAVSPWMVSLMTPYVLHGLSAAGVIKSLKHYALVTRIERVESLAEEGVLVSVRPIEEEAE